MLHCSSCLHGSPGLVSVLFRPGLRLIWDAWVQQTKVSTLEKANQDLSWQIAMLTRGGQQDAPRPTSPRHRATPEAPALDPGSMLHPSNA